MPALAESTARYPLPAGGSVTWLEPQTAEDLMSRLADDPRYYVEHCLWIRDKDSELVPFILNEPQLKIYKAIEELKAQGKPVRVIILKARQPGVSTLIEALMFHDTATRELVESLVLAHDLDSTQTIFEITQRFHDHLPQPVKPKTRYSNRKEIVFEDPNVPGEGLGSKIQVGTAGSSEVGRASTRKNVHCSEVAFWPDAGRVMLGVKQAVPEKPNTMVVLESTANGMGGYFYNEWRRAVTGESDYIPIFLGTQDIPEYRRQPETGFERTPEEQELVKRYGLDDWQLAWRRHAIRNLCDGDIDKFNQEYPYNDVEAFLMSGRPVFAAKEIDWYLKQTTKPIQGELRFVEGKIGGDPRPVRWTQQARGRLSVWRAPKKGREYALGADVAEGVSGGAYSVAVVIDREENREVARWRGHVAPDLFALEILKLSKFYRLAPIGVEVNNHGLVTLTKLRDLLDEGKERIELYQRQVWDSTLRRYIMKLGWKTDTRTRAILIDYLAALVRDHVLHTEDELLINECRTMQYDDMGVAQPETGCLDDCVFAMGIAQQVDLTIPRKPKKKKKKKLSKDALQTQKAIARAALELRFPVWSREEVNAEVARQEALLEEGD